MTSHGHGTSERGTRARLLRHLADAVESVVVDHPKRVAIDGPPASGKTTMADDLALVLQARRVDVIRASVDDFLVPRARRYLRGQYSAESCYHDAHDRAALNELLLDPLGPGGNRRFRRSAYDHDADTIASPSAVAEPGAVLVFDGVFLLRPELVDRWELRVHLTVDAEVATTRAVARDRALAPATAVERRWRDRYLPAQRLYAASAHPADRADVVVDNTDPRQPLWMS